MRAGVFSTPRPVPGRRIPTLAGAGVVALSLPVFLVGGIERLGERGDHDLASRLKYSTSEVASESVYASA